MEHIKDALRMRMSASLTQLKRMTGICTDEVKFMDMVFNASKSVVVRICQSFTHRRIVVLLDGSEQLVFVPQARYIGVTLCMRKRFKIVSK